MWIYDIYICMHMYQSTLDSDTRVAHFEARLFSRVGPRAILSFEIRDWQCPHVVAAYCHVITFHQ